MKVIILYVSLFFSIDGISCGMNITKRSSSLSDCDMIPLSLYDCEEIGYMDVQMTLKTTNDNGGKAFDFKARIGATIDKSAMLKVAIFKKSDDSWKDNIYEKEDSICAFLLNFVPIAWENLKVKVSPPIEEKCAIQPGEYEMKDFEVSPMDCSIPTTMSGIFKIELSLADESGELIACKIGEIEIQCDD